MFEVSHLEFSRSDQVLFRNLTFSIGSKSWLWLKGKNGSGKSSLLRVLIGFLLPTKGHLFWENKKLKRFDPSFLDQLFYLSHVPAINLTLSPLENLTWWLRLQRFQEPQARARILQVLEELDLTHVQNLSCEQLSFGERQRVSLARLRLQKKRFWLLDEPYTGLDESGKTWVNQQLQDHLKETGLAMVASHEPLSIQPPAFKTIDLDLDLTK